jgi:hypothetical protein
VAFYVGERNQDDPADTRREGCAQQVLEPASVGLWQEALRAWREQNPGQVDHDVNTVNRRMKRLRIGKICQDRLDVRGSLKAVWQGPAVSHQTEVVPTSHEMLREQPA